MPASVEKKNDFATKSSAASPARNKHKKKPILPGPERSAHRPLISDETLRSLYSAMLGCRRIEEAKQSQGKRQARRKIISSSTKLITGLEAVIVGTTFDLRTEDTIAAPGSEVIFRRSDSSGKSPRRDRQPVPRDIIASTNATGTQLTIGAGIALGNSNHQTDRIVVSFGDADAQSIASWNEALQLAGLHRLPIIFVLSPEANPGSDEYKGVLSVIADGAATAGVIMIPVDAIDVVAMYRVAFEAIARARNGTGATLIVCTHYRVDGSDGDLVSDPLLRMEEYLARKGLFSKQWKKQLLRQFS